MAKLTDKQRAFVEHYLQTWNATDAARRAEYRGTYESLRVIGSQNLTKPNVKKAIEKRMRALTISADEVLIRLAQQATSSVSEFIDKHGVIDWEKVKDRGFLVKAIKHTKGKNAEIKLHDSQRALELLGKYYTLFSDRIEHTGKDGGPIEIKNIEDVRKSRWEEANPALTELVSENGKSAE